MLAGALAALTLAAAPAAAAARAHDPELALLLLYVQKQSARELLGEMRRLAEAKGLGAMRVLLGEKGETFAQRASESLDGDVDADLVEAYRRALLEHSPGSAAEIERLAAAVRRAHDLRPGSPLERVPVPRAGAGRPQIFEELGAGAELQSALDGAAPSAADEERAERRFGAAGRFVLSRKWAFDFYLGRFSDLIGRYQELGYRRFYRLRAPFVGRGRSVYVLAPEPGLRPRLIYCGFQGRDPFAHARAQWLVLARALAVKGEGPVVRTLACPACEWSPPAARSMGSLLEEVPYVADTVVLGLDWLFARQWKDRLLGVYENEDWTLSYYELPSGVAATARGRHPGFGEIAAASLEPLVRRGARRVLYVSRAASLGTAPLDRLAVPAGFMTIDGAVLDFGNALASGRREPLHLVHLASPLLATPGWAERARARGIAGYDAELARLAEEAGKWRGADGARVELGLAAVLVPPGELNPEEERPPRDPLPAEKEFRDRVAALLKKPVR